jgi:O-antigen/teichoic acid export membrane protein
MRAEKVSSSEINLDQAENQNSFNIRAFSRDVIVLSFGEVILLVFGIIQSLILPKYLTTEDYGYWQLFLLISSYVGILHFGFLDGVFISWAGKDLKDIKNDISLAFRFLLFEQVIVVIIIAVLVILLNLPNKEMAFAVLANAILINLLMFFILTTQAVKRFRLLTLVNIGRGGLFLLFILVFFGSGQFNSTYVILSYFCTSLILSVLFIFYMRDILFHRTSQSLTLLKFGLNYISIGIFVLCGNFIALTFFTFDRLIVSSFFSISQFAQYAFAMVLCGLVFTYLSTVSLVFFPHLAGSSMEFRDKAYQILKPGLIIFWGGMLAVSFPFSAFVIFYLPQYAGSLPLMQILLVTIGFNGLIQILQINYFKAHHMQRSYFILAGFSLGCSAILALVAITFIGTLASIAAATVISFGIWYLLNEFSLQKVISLCNMEILKGLLIYLSYALVFWAVCIINNSWIIGMGAYLIFFTVFTGIFLRSESVILLNLIKRVINRN